MSYPDARMDCEPFPGESADAYRERLRALVRLTCADCGVAVDDCVCAPSEEVYDLPANDLTNEV